MFKKTINYVDYDGNERTEDFFFNFTKAELIEMQYSAVGGLQKYISNIISANDQPKLISLFKDLVLKAYGQKSPDGRRFIKSQELRDEFAQTEAYSIIFMELATNDKAAQEFVNGITPKLEQTPSMIPGGKNTGAN